MADDFIDLEGAPAPAPEDDNVIIDVYEPGQEQEEQTAQGDALAEAQKRIAELEAAQSQMAPMNALAEQLKSIAQPRTVEVPKEEPKQGVDYKKLFSDVNSDFYSNPSENIVKIITPILNELNANQTSKDAEKDTVISKLTVKNDPTYSSIYNKYEDEVEKLASSMPPSMTRYQDAVEQVRKNHYDDIVSEKAAALAAELVEKALQEKGLGQKQPAFTNAGMPPSVSGQEVKKDVFRVAKSSFNFAKSWADEKGFPFESVDDQKWVIGYLRDKGRIN